MQQKDITCSSCGALFGKESNGALHIKHRDLYRTIEGGRVTGPCRGCATEVVWVSKKEVK